MVNAGGEVGIATKVITQNLRIESGSGDEKLPEATYHLDSEVSEDEDIPEQYRHIYATDNYEWNDCKGPTGEEYQFNEDKCFLLSFRRWLRIPSKGNKNIYGFNYMAQNYNSSQQSNPIDGLY